MKTCPKCKRLVRNRLDQYGDLCPIEYAYEHLYEIPAAEANCQRAQNQNV